MRGAGVACQERLEIGGVDRVEHDFTRGFGGVETGGGPVETLDADDVPGAADIAERGRIGGFVPERDGALLDHVDEGRVRRGLPADVLVGCVEFHAAPRGEGDQVGFVHELEGRMLLKEVCDPVGDGGRLHVK